MSYVRGIHNPSSVCYLNCVLQALASVKSFRDYVRGLSDRDNRNLSPFTRNLSNTLQALVEVGKGPEVISAEKIHCYLNEKMRLNEQQDAQELFHHVMQIIDEEQQHAKHIDDADDLWADKDEVFPEIINHVDNNEQKYKFNPFLGTFESLLRCTKCRGERISIENFLDVVLSIPKSTCNLESCFRSFIEEEKIEGVHCHNCSTALGPSDWVTEKKLTLCSIPSVLCINLRRLNMGLWGSGKVTSKVAFSRNLEVSPFRSAITCDQSKTNYSLKAVIEHLGGVDGLSGHYVTYRKFQKNRWFYCSDQHANEVAEDTVFKANAYMLFYEQETFGSGAAFVDGLCGKLA